MAATTTTTGRTAPTPGRPARLMPQVVQWHVGLGELGLRLFLLHLLWSAGILAGVIVLGAAPATAALHAVLRRDQRDRALEEAGEEVVARPRLWTEFWAVWRSEFVRANLLGGFLAAAWIVLLVNRHLLGVGIGEATAWISGAVVVLTIALALVSIAVWPVFAHFAEPLPRILMMSLVLLLRKLPMTVSIVAVAAGTVWIWQSFPGLAPVFGIVLPCWAVTVITWRSGIFPLR